MVKSVSTATSLIRDSETSSNRCVGRFWGGLPSAMDGSSGGLKIQDISHMTGLGPGISGDNRDG